MLVNLGNTRQLLDSLRLVPLCPNHNSRPFKTEIKGIPWILDTPNIIRHKTPEGIVKKTLILGMFSWEEDIKGFQTMDFGWGIFRKKNTWSIHEAQSPQLPTISNRTTARCQNTGILCCNTIHTSSNLRHNHHFIWTNDMMLATTPTKIAHWGWHSTLPALKSRWTSSFHNFW